MNGSDAGAGEPPDGSVPVVLRGNSSSSMPATTADSGDQPARLGISVGNGNGRVDDDDDSDADELVAAENELEEFEERPSREQERSRSATPPWHYPPPIEAGRERRLFSGATVDPTAPPRHLPGRSS